MHTHPVNICLTRHLLQIRAGRFSPFAAPDCPRTLARFSDGPDVPERDDSPSLRGEVSSDSLKTPATSAFVSSARSRGKKRLPTRLPTVGKIQTRSTVFREPPSEVCRVTRSSRTHEGRSERTERGPRSLPREYSEVKLTHSERGREFLAQVTSSPSARFCLPGTGRVLGWRQRHLQVPVARRNHLRLP